MIKRLFYFSLVLILFSIVPVFAQLDPSYRFEQNTNTTLVVLCNNDTVGLCDSSVTCNINVQKPNTTIIFNNESMDFMNPGRFGINLSQDNNDQIGFYTAGGSCVLGTSALDFNFLYEVTPTGHSLTTSQGIILTLGMLFILFVGFVFLFISGKSETLPIKITSLGFGLLLVVFSIGYSLNVMNQVAGEFASVNTLFSKFYVMLTLLLIAGGLALAMFLLVFAFKSFNKLRGLTIE